MEQSYLEQLQSALAAGDKELVLGAVRLLEAGDNLEKVPAELLAGAARFFEESGLHLQAARLLRLAAANGAEQAGELLWRACCLLAGPGQCPELAAETAQLLLSEEDELQKQQASRLLRILAEEDMDGLAALLAGTGIKAPATVQTKPVVPSAGPVRPAAIVVARPPTALSPLGRRLSLGLVGCLAAWLMGSLLRDRLGSVGEIHPQLLAEPEQLELEEAEPVRLTRGEYHLTLYPRFSYRICGLVVSVNTYAMLGLRFQDFYERDLCLVWGKNVSTRAFAAPGTSFEHHGNTCYSQWQWPTPINGRQLSNNHIFSTDDDLRRSAANLRRGDQVCLEGQLVDVTAVLRRAPPGGGIPAPMRLHTSTTRNDDGDGACEILLLQNLEVLERANRPWRFLAAAGFWGAVLCLLLLVLSAAWRHKKTRRT